MSIVRVFSQPVLVMIISSVGETGNAGYDFPSKGTMIDQYQVFHIIEIQPWILWL